MEVSEKTLTFVNAQDAKLNKQAGWESNQLATNLRNLVEFGRVEVGWRESCGHTDPTARQYAAWKKVVTHLIKDGFQIQELRVKHGNGYATMKGGFWSSIVYSLAPNPA